METKMNFGEAIMIARFKKNLSLTKAAALCKIPAIRLSELERQITTIKPSRYEINLLKTIYKEDFNNYSYLPDNYQIRLEKDSLNSILNNHPEVFFAKYGIVVLKH